jgi:ATP-dependent helicase/DNAse subunit B
MVILLLEERGNAFFARVGTIFHAVLQALYASPSFDFETSWAKAVADEADKNGAFTPKEKALFLRLKDECSYAVAFYQRHDSLLVNATYRAEQAFHLASPENPLVSFAGQYDKIVEFGSNQRYYAIIDYKTGAERFDEGMLPYGLSMQLPYYAYYASQAPELQGAELIGLFIGPILSPTLVKNVKDTLEKFNNDKFKLEGVFAKDISKMLQFDPSASQSDFIRSLAYSESKGFRSYSLARAKSPEEFATLAESAKKLTLEADERIRKDDFAISPAVYKGTFDACAYCPYRDICYRKDEAIRHLPLTPGVQEDDEEGEESEEEANNGME